MQCCGWCVILDSHVVVEGGAEDFLAIGVGGRLAEEAVVGEACSEAKAQVAGKTRASTALPE